MSVRRGFSAELRKRTDPLWRAIHAHPFVRAIGDGSLSQDRYRFYLEQDYVYLIELSRVMALAVAKAEKLDDMRTLAGLLQATLAQEMEQHRRTCAGIGIDPVELERTEPGLITTAYSSALLRVCHEGRLHDVLAALLPCESVYVEIAACLRKNGLPPPGPCRDWIEAYSSPQMRGLAEWFARRLDASARGSSTADRERWLRLFTMSMRFELLFFDACWQESTWPACVPV